MVLLFYVSPSSPQLQSRFKENAKILSKDFTTQENRQNLLFLLKTKKNNHSSASDSWDNTKYSFKENDRAFSKNSTSKENLQDELYELENTQAKAAKLRANIR